MINTFKALSLLSTVVFSCVAMADLPLEEPIDISARGGFSELPTELADISAQGGMPSLPTDLAVISAQGGLSDLPTGIADVSAQGGLAELPTELAGLAAQGGVGGEIVDTIETLSEFPNLHEAMNNQDDDMLDGLMLTQSESLLKLKKVK